MQTWVKMVADFNIRFKTSETVQQITDKCKNNKKSKKKCMQYP